MVNHKDNPLYLVVLVNESYVADGVELRSTVVSDISKLKMLGCKSQFRIKPKLFRKYWCVSSSPKISSSVSPNPRRESQADSRMDLFKTTLSPHRSRLAATHDEINAVGIDKKNKKQRPQFSSIWQKWFQLTDFLLPLYHRVASRLNGADFVRSGLDVPERGQMETHQHSGTL